MKEIIITLKCPLCATKKEVESKIMYSKKLFYCDNKPCKFGAEHHKWIKIFPDGKVVYPNPYP